MPLNPSGAALFAGSASEFIEMAPASNLTAHLTREFNRRWGTATETEVRSWRKSLTSLASVVEASAVDQSGVGVELKLPLTDKRIDASFVGRDNSRRPGVVLVELKQWKAVTVSRFPDNVVVGGQEHLHPSVQAGSYAAYLRDSHSAFTEDGFGLSACAFLHASKSADAAAIRTPLYQAALRDAPVYTADEGTKLSEFLVSTLGRGDGISLLPSLVAGRYSPSKALIEGIAKALRGSPVWTLLDEQRLAFNIVRGMVDRASKTGKKAVVVVVGGPGTGKSVIAAHLLVTLAEGGGRSVCHATGSKAFTTNLRAISPRGGAAVFRYFNNFRHRQTEASSMDVILCDEAHRLRETSNDRFTRKDLKSDLSQVREIIRAAKVSVFFLDERQNVRPGEVGTVQVIEDGALDEGADIQRVVLSGQFRCNGCGRYIDWVDALMSQNPVPSDGWLEVGDYELRVFDDPGQMETALRERNCQGATARLVGGFCWPWSDPNADGSLEADVRIGGWKRPWNEKSPEQCKPARPAPAVDRHPYYLWATQPSRIGEIGCIYSAQGFEFDYCGVILGNDLVWRDGIGWVGSREASSDPSITRRRVSQNELLALLQHTYRVLLTRGMKGTFIYSTDRETRDFLKRTSRSRSSQE